MKWKKRTKMRTKKWKPQQNCREAKESKAATSECENNTAQLLRKSSGCDDIFNFIQFFSDRCFFFPFRLYFTFCVVYVGEGSGAKLFSSAEQMTRRDRQRTDAFSARLALTSLPFSVSLNENPPSFADENCTGKPFCSRVQVVLDAARFKFYFQNYLDGTRANPTFYTVKTKKLTPE